MDPQLPTFPPSPRLSPPPLPFPVARSSSPTRPLFSWSSDPLGLLAFAAAGHRHPPPPLQGVAPPPKGAVTAVRSGFKRHRNVLDVDDCRHRRVVPRMGQGRGEELALQNVGMWAPHPQSTSSPTLVVEAPRPGEELGSQSIGCHQDDVARSLLPGTNIVVAASTSAISVASELLAGDESTDLTPEIQLEID